MKFTRQKEGKRIMTLFEIENMADEVLTCKQVAPLLKANPYTLHMQAMEDPSMLGFPVIVCGRRVKIPRQPFLRFMRGEYVEECV